jgi:hypothetical protein
MPGGSLEKMIGLGKNAVCGCTPGFWNTDILLREVLAQFYDGVDDVASSVGGASGAMRIQLSKARRCCVEGRAKFPAHVFSLVYIYIYISILPRVYVYIRIKVYI